MHNSVQQFDTSPGQPGNALGYCPEEPADGAKGGGSTVEAGREGFNLTPLEKKIIALTVAGYSRQERAGLLGISRQALGSQLQILRDRLNVACDIELILFALYYQLVDTCHSPRPCDTKGPLQALRGCRSDE
jgi:DNA-binding CsgD family transcriptional regulator